MLLTRRMLVALLFALGVSPACAAEPVHLYTAVPGDTLIHLGQRLLVDPSRWPEIASANAMRNPNYFRAGTVLRIPLRLMHTEPVPATLLNVSGQATSGAGVPWAAGQSVDESAEVHTGADGHVTLRLVDGTSLRLRPASQLKVRESRRVRGTDSVRSATRLEQGRVEVEAKPARAGRPGFEIDTPQGVLGVRGTEFRVASDPVQQVTRGEVLTGAVAFADRSGGATAENVPAGFGTVIGATGGVATPVRLLGPPDISALPTLHERLLVRFAIPDLAGATAYRGQVARNPKFDDVVADLTSATPELRFAGLPDGDYILRVRAIDAQGLEGQDADLPFKLKARPEAPLPSAPTPRAVLHADHAEFAWAANEQAQSYRLQVATDETFKQPLHDLKDLRSLNLKIDDLRPGNYHWRMASVRAGDDRGPWGATQNFELRPLPATPIPKPPAVGEKAINFSWEGAPGQTFEFQVAREITFAELVFEQTLSEPSIELPLPGTGRFYVRLRARDADGFIGPYTTPQRFDVPNCLRDSSGECVRAAGALVIIAP